MQLMCNKNQKYGPGITNCWCNLQVACLLAGGANSCCQILQYFQEQLLDMTVYMLHPQYIHLLTPLLVQRRLKI
jgi:Ethanolamine utilization protein EutJ (predicted chaperonin)